MINHKFSIGNALQETLYRIDNWINEGFGWIVESIDSQYINISTYWPFLGSSYVILPADLRNPRKGLINIKNKDQNFFLWCHVRYINPVEIHPERIRKDNKKLVRHMINPEKIPQADKEPVSDLGYDGTEFAVQEKDFSKFEKKNNTCTNVFGYENGLTFPVYVLGQKFKDSMLMSLLIDDDKFHYMCIKDFDRFMFHKRKNKNKKYFCKSCLQCFSSKIVLTEHKKVCLSINGEQSVKLEKGMIN